MASRLQTALDETRSSAPPKVIELPAPRPAASMEPPVQTGVARETLDRIAEAVHTVPEGFTAHPKLAKQLATRAGLYQQGEVDWALGEAFAFGSLLLDGKDVRLAGQDSRRGTFSHRHSVLIDYSNGNEFCPLGRFGDTGNARKGPVSSDASSSTTHRCPSTQHLVLSTVIQLLTRAL